MFNMKSILLLVVLGYTLGGQTQTEVIGAVLGYTLGGATQTITVNEVIGAAWKVNTGASINSIASDAYVSFVDTQGRLNVINQASKEMAGGLISTDLTLPPGTRYFALDVVFDLSGDDLAHYARGENDLKVTFPGGAQANGSCQWNASTGQWQLDPTGTAWVNSGYSQPPVVGRNELQLRLFFDGLHWTVTGLRVNQDPNPFTPGVTFQNLPSIATNWTTGLHPQLQTEVTGVPWYLREIYERVRVMSSVQPIPWVFD